MQRRIIFLAAVVLGLIVLSFFGLTPPILWEKAKSFCMNGVSAAQNTRRMSNERQQRISDATAIFDSKKH